MSVESSALMEGWQNLPSDYKNVASSVPVYHYHTSDFIVNLRTQPADPSSSEGCSERASLMLYLRCEDRPITDDPLDRHVIAINASPLERDHSLIIPSVNKCLPQVLTPTAIRIATDVMLLVTDDSFNILFNSLLGQASVNHLHMHCLYWPYESDLINRRFEPLNDLTNVYIIEPPNWLCSAFAFQLRTIDEYDTFRNCSVRKLHFFSGAKPPTNFNPAANELAGCLTSYSKSAFHFFQKHFCFTSELTKPHAALILSA
ncbi:unnamed protein product [Nippostrongylus brasiliensis]|uniref:GDP-D-glucose phosphorylase 1 n=1 Tax=Nippostrongylus brasiliensis TaxID=27835 RepID=A0A0N4YAD4_NIPBR|nr:unnamed protein product [Nippostrongylus brasiliensis]